MSSIIVYNTLWKSYQYNTQLQVAVYGRMTWKSICVTLSFSFFMISYKALEDRLEKS